uniref:EF-hand domain-containing protein n=1 Tax=Plectus sambesii TaxID=2011161 RepID=A0A914XMG7_9BILA
TPAVEQWTADLAKEYMRSLMSGQQRLYFRKFAHFYNMNAHRPASEMRDALDAFKEFDTAVRGSISREQLEDAPKHKFDWLANVLESRRKGVPARDEL